MKSILSAFVTLAIAAVHSLPASTSHVVHEKRNVEGGSWSVRSNTEPDPDFLLPVRVGLVQIGLEQGHDILMDVSHPESPNYGKHLSAKEVTELFAPPQSNIDAVRDWLVASGIDDRNITLSKGKNWLNFKAPIFTVESLLQTKYNVYEHSNGQDHVGCENYSVPVHLRELIDIVTPTVHFDAKVSGNKNIKREVPSSSQPGSPSNKAWQPKKGKVIGSSKFASSSAPNSTALSTCNTQITPECLRALYGIPNGTLDGSSYGIVEYTPQAYLQADLDDFFASYESEIPTGTGPALDSVDGGVDQTTSQGFDYNGESNLDLEYAIALVYPQTVTLYQVGDEVEGASFGNFLDAIDASFCTYEGGDNPVYDATYPDPDGGYQSQDCGTYDATSVISTSYGYNEADLPVAYEIRQCYEYMKLGLQGVTVVYSSGDYGVAGNGGQCCTEEACAGGTYNNGNSGTFNPAFPSTCPYVTSIGATQIVPGASVTAPEEACETIIYSGGGFSNVFPIPDYQSSAVAAYYASSAPTYDETQYNNTQTVRGYPDISANGANYVVAIDGELALVYGTSASAPVVGSIFTLINNERISAGKGTIGFVNPVLYANPEALNDIVSGGNQGCGTAGFTAVSGWDPVTGLGTPNYPALLDVFLALD